MKIWLARFTKCDGNMGTDTAYCCNEALVLVLVLVLAAGCPFRAAAVSPSRAVPVAAEGGVPCRGSAI